MKRIIYISIISILALTACKEEWLEIPIEVDPTVENFYKTEADAEKALVAAYSVLKFSGNGGSPTELGGLHGANYFAVGDITSDDAEKGGENRNDGAAIGDLSEFIGKSENSVVKTLWRDNYIGINRANVALQNIPNIKMDEALKAQYLGELKFLRAYFNFYLVRVFGDVPLVDHLLAPSEYFMPRIPKSEVYEFIEKDLLEAIPALPLKSKYKPEWTGRVTQGAAQALLAKVYVFQEKWADAEAMAKNVIDSKEYDLETLFSKIFTMQGENCSESVFEVQFMESNNTKWHSSNNGNTFYTFMRSRSSQWPTKGEGWGFNCPTQNLFDAYENDDPRRDLTIVTDGEDDPWGLGVKLYTDKGKTNLTGYLNQKYILHPNDVPQNWSDCPNNLRLIRYADVVLWYAEACFHNGKEVEARTAVNMVRARARKEAKNPTTALPDVTVSGNDLLKAIWHERRVELAMEGHRFFDLVRQKRAAEVLNSFYATNPVLKLSDPFQTGIHELFPIPQEQIDLSKGNLTQNSGY